MVIILGLAGPKVQEQMATQTAADFFLRKTKSARSLLLHSAKPKHTAVLCLLLFASVSSRESVGEHHHHPRRRHCPILGPLLRQLISVSPSLSTNSGPRTDFSLGCNFSGTATPPSPPPPPPSSSARHISHLCSGRCILPRILCNIVATTRSHSLSIAQTPLQTLKRERKKEKALGHTTEHRTERTFFEVFVCLPLSVCVFIGALAAAIAEAVLLRTEHTEHTHSR